MDFEPIIIIYQFDLKGCYMHLMYDDFLKKLKANGLSFKEEKYDYSVELYFSKISKNKLKTLIDIYDKHRNLFYNHDESICFKLHM